MSADTQTELTAENINSWLAALPACTLSLLPIYWLIMTAPPDARAEKRKIITVLKELTSDTPETAESPTKLTTNVSAIPTSSSKNCSTKSGIIIARKSLFVNSLSSI